MSEGFLQMGKNSKQTRTHTHTEKLTHAYSHHQLHLLGAKVGGGMRDVELRNLFTLFSQGTWRVGEKTNLGLLSV